MPHTYSSADWHILIIDDSADDRAELRQKLLLGNERRCRFTEAASGAEGVKAVADAGPTAFDCVLLDYSMPDMNAGEVLAALHGSTQMQPCPILVITGTTWQEGPRLVRAGAQDYIGKSATTPQSLTRAIENSIQRWTLQHEHQRAKHELALERKRLALALTAGQMGVFELNLHDGQLWWSPEVYALFGVEEENFELTRASFRMLVHPEDRALPFRAVTEGWTSQERHTPEFRIIRPDGHERWMAHCGQTETDAAGRPSRHFGVVQDITSRKAAEAEQCKLDKQLRDQQFYTRSLIESNADALVMTDPLGFVSDVNAPLEYVTGRTRHELIGAHWRTLFTDPARADLGLSLARDKSSLQEFELTVQALDGRQTQVSCNANTLLDRERVVLGVLVSARDVTQRHFLDSALQEMNASLESAHFFERRGNRAKSALLMQVGYEVRTTLKHVQAMRAATPAPGELQLPALAAIETASLQMLAAMERAFAQTAVHSHELDQVIPALDAPPSHLDKLDSQAIVRAVHRPGSP